MHHRKSTILCLLLCVSMGLLPSSGLPVVENAAEAGVGKHSHLQAQVSNETAPIQAIHASHPADTSRFWSSPLLFIQLHLGAAQSGPSLPVLVGVVCIAVLTTAAFLFKVATSKRKMPSEGGTEDLRHNDRYHSISDDGGNPAELARRPRGAKGTRFSAKPSIIKQQGGSLFVPNSPPEQQLSGEGGLPASGLQRQGSDPIIGGEPSADAPERQSSRVRAAKSRWEPSALGQINEGLL